MKRILTHFAIIMMALLAFNACSDVPSPYNVDGGDNSGGGTVVGDGSKEKPYDVTTAMEKQGETEKWVKGYIVGCVNDKSIQTDAAFEAPFKNPANILIAASASEKDYTKCLAVQLPIGDVRTKINLVDNATNLGKEVSLKGNLIAYFGVAGLKETNDYLLDGEGPTPGEPTDPDNPFGLSIASPVTTFEATFEDVTNNADYTLTDWINASEEGDRKWQGAIFNTTDKYIKATAYKGTAGQSYETWFITPAFVVDNIQDKTVSFDCAGAYFVETTSLKVYFLELVDGKMQQTEISVASIPTSGSNYAWVKGINIDLSAYAGKTGFIGFKYTGIGGESGTSATYCLDNIKTGKVASGGEQNPGGETPVGSNLLTNPGFEEWTADLPTAWDNATYNTGISKETTIKHGGNNSVKHTIASSTVKLQQEVAVTAGKKYRISYWYLDNDVNAKYRPWSYWLNDSNATITDNADVFRPTTYSEDNAAWQQVTMTVTAPDTASKFRFEIRTYKGTDVGGSIYFDDFEVVEVE